MIRSLITGGCGFVGRHLTKRLLQAGHEVWIVDDLSTGQDPAQWLRAQDVNGSEVRTFSDDSGGTVKFLHENLTVTMMRQLGLLNGKQPVKLPEFDYIFALASIVGGRTKIDGDPLGVGMDLAIDALFFQWLARNKSAVRRVLYASSSAAYPVNLQSREKTLALSEEMIDFRSSNLGQPDMTYGWSKLTGEYLSFLAAERYGISVACVRPFSGYGEDQDLSYPVPAIAYRVARGDDPVTVWGTGEQGRDFVHIEDCITAMLLAADRIQDGSGVNIGTGKLTTFLEVAGKFVELDKRSAQIKPQVDMPVGVQSRYCDPANMQRMLQWTPTISLEQGFGMVLNAAHQRVQQMGPAAIA